jgi:hypothetical protein
MDHPGDLTNVYRKYPGPTDKNVIHKKQGTPGCELEVPASQVLSNIRQDGRDKNLRYQPVQRRGGPATAGRGWEHREGCSEWVWRENRDTG